MRIVLASASPRRIELLERIDLQFEVITSSVEEDYPTGLGFAETAMELANLKAWTVARQLSGASQDIVVIGADTIVVKDGILGKPKDREDACRILEKLQGQAHEVITGLAVINLKSGESQKAFERTVVEMVPLSSREIELYVNTGEPMDKAGAYGIQGLAGIFIRRIEGCYYNVVGLPLQLLWTMLRRAGVNAAFPWLHCPVITGRR